MDAFESYLIDKGYKVYHQDFSNGKVKNIDGHKQLSSLTNINNVYVKNGIEIIYGLSEIGLPGTLISPRPLLYSFDGTKHIAQDCRDHYMHNILKTKSFDEILNNIEKGNKIWD